MTATFAATLLAALTAGPAAEAAGPPVSCLPDGSGFLVARLRGALDLDLDWREPEIECTGMPRPDGRGIRLRFAGPLPGGGTLAIVFAPPVLAEVASARAVPVNVTLIHETSGRIFGTLGEDRCLLDQVSQTRVASDEDAARAWIVEASGFCTGPARALDDSGVVLLTRFDFKGRVTRGESPTVEAEHEPSAPDS